MMLKGAVSRKGTLSKSIYPLKDLKKQDADRELISRGIYIDDKAKAPEYKEQLCEHMAGIQRVPAIIFDNPTQDLQEIGLDSYELVGVEPMHDLTGHTKNLYDVIPSYVAPEQKTDIEILIKQCLGLKEIPLCKDVRLSIIKLLLFKDFREKYGTFLFEILRTLAEMQRIMYSGESRRTPKQILRYNLVAFKHYMQCPQLFKKKQSLKITKRRMYGKYYHNLITHAGLSLRIFSGQTSHVERQEGCFGKMKLISKQACSKQANKFEVDMIIRFGIENNMKGETQILQSEDEISKWAKELPKLGNTFISHKLIRENKKDWCQLLITISDYLYGEKDEDCWYDIKEDGIHFRDGEGNKETRQGKVVHHFRSSSMKSEQVELKKKWKELSVKVKRVMLREAAEIATTNEDSDAEMDDIRQNMEEANDENYDFDDHIGEEDQSIDTDKNEDLGGYIGEEDRPIDTDENEDLGGHIEEQDQPIDTDENDNLGGHIEEADSPIDADTGIFSTAVYKSYPPR